MESNRAARWAWPAAFIGCVTLAGLESLRLGKDVNWDLENYHFYNAYAWIHGRLTHDVAPAMAQTFHNPLADLPFFYMVQAGLPTRAIELLMAVPAGVAAYFLLRLLAVLFSRDGHDRRWWIGCAFAIGIMGSAGRGVIGSTMNEWPCTALVTAALATLAPKIEGRPGAMRLALAGLLAGAAMGLKLTYASFALALGIAAMSFVPLRESARRATFLAAFGLAGFLATYGFWGATLQREFGNPFFPYLNGIFQSPWWELVSFHDDRYGPRNVVEAITYPFRFAFNGRVADDARFRDPRLATLFVLAVACIAAHRRAARRDNPFLTPRWRFMAVFAVVAYLAWITTFAIYRYLIPLELVSGGLMIACIHQLAASHATRRRAATIIALLVIAATFPPKWGRMRPGDSYFGPAPPDLPPKSLVVLEPHKPLAYLIPLWRQDARFVAPDSNMLNPHQRNGLARRAAELLANPPGPIYALDYADGVAMDPLLAHFGLRREPACTPFASPLTGTRLRLCPVARAGR